MILREKKVARAGIPTASMGDVAFLILIFFLTSTVFTKDKGLKMLLPEKTTEQEQVQVEPENIVTVSINPVGEAKVKTVNLDQIFTLGQYGEIRSIIEERLLARDTLLVVSVRPSREAPYKNMIHALDQIKLAKTTTADGRELRVTRISLIPTSGEQ
jgi:biopolymer transport protein ExbD